MFERYTEKARRVIFFARYEASQFGAPAIEPEHLLLGLMREDKTLTGRFFPRAQVSIESIRKEIEGRTLLREKISTSVELPLAPETKRVLAYAHEESDRLQHRHIGTEHLLLGLLREERSMAAEILYERGLRLNAVRDEIARTAVARNNHDYIQFHYDLGNDFYQLFLDQEMQYSCGYFTDWQSSLEQAQRDKMEMVCRKLRLQAGERLLDIGCGWGGLICHAARNYGVQGRRSDW